MLWNELVIEINRKDIDKASIFFDNMGFPSVSIDDPGDIIEHKEQVRWDYIDDGLFKRDMETAYVKAYTEDDKKADEVGKEAFAQGFNFTVYKLEEEDWENGWKKYFKPLPIGKNVVVVPAWEDYSPKPEEKIITLDSGMAFGTGSHETTKMCVEYIEKYMKKGSTVLDIGTGSGILAICSGLFGAGKVEAIDIDELSVKIAGENAALNHMENLISVREGDLLTGVSGEFDFICANIVADVISGLLPDVKRFMKKDGYLLISGIISERAPEIIEIIDREGYKIVEMKTEKDWTAFVLIRN